MTNLFIAELYRLLNSKFFYLILLALAIVSIVSAAQLAVIADKASECSTFPFALYSANELIAGPVLQAPQSASSAYGTTFLSGSFLPICASVTAIFISCPIFTSGFNAHLICNPSRRIFHAVALILCSCVANAIFVSLSFGLHESILLSAGFTYQITESSVQIAFWLAIVWILTCSCSVSCCTVCLISQRIWPGVLYSVLLSSGIVTLISRVPDLNLLCFCIFAPLSLLSPHTAIAFTSYGTEAFFTNEGIRSVNALLSGILPPCLLIAFSLIVLLCLFPKRRLT